MKDILSLELKLYFGKYEDIFKEFIEEPILMTDFFREYPEECAAVSMIEIGGNGYLTHVENNVSQSLETLLEEVKYKNEFSKYLECLEKLHKILN